MATVNRRQEPHSNSCNRAAAAVNRDDAPLQPSGSGATLQAWPTCPRCHSKRHTWCSSCGTAGAEFLLVDPRVAPDSDDPDAFWVICPTCDDVFAPQFYRKCEWCGHDFGDGLTVDPEPPSNLQEAAFSTREKLVMLILAGILFCTIAYFALVASPSAG